MNKEQIKKARNIADTYAASMGKDSIADVIKPIQEGLNSDDLTVQDLARSQARATVEQLSRLILRQEIFTNPDANYIYQFVNKFNDGVVNEGNGKLYDFNNATGVDSWDPAKFIPDNLTTTSVDEFKIEMYNTNGALNTSQGYQFKKPITFIEKNWIPYFRAGNLIGFIGQLQANMEKAWNYYMFDKLATKITATTTTYKKTIQGTAANAFDAWSTEILPAIRNMTLLSAEYNQKTGQNNLMLSNPKDLLIIASSKTIQTLESGIKSQVFNAKFLDLRGILDESNFTNLGNKITVGATTDAISVSNTPYVDDNTIYVIHKDAIKHFTQVDRVETQSFAHNLSTTIVMHKWGALDFLPWGQCFKYTNQHLNTLP